MYNTQQGVIRKHAENYRDFVAQGKSGGAPAGTPGPHEAGMKRIREYNDFCAKNQPKPSGASALMEVGTVNCDIGCVLVYVYIYI